MKGDANCLSIAAASIVAKVTRDRMMVEYHRMYPAYSFDRNKGYGTKAHYEGIEKEGICPIHRKSFLKKKSCSPTETNPAVRPDGKQSEGAERRLIRLPAAERRMTEDIGNIRLIF